SQVDRAVRVLADQNDDVRTGLDRLQTRGGEGCPDRVDRADADGSPDHGPGKRHRDEDPHRHGADDNHVLDETEAPAATNFGHHAWPPSLLPLGTDAREPRPSRRSYQAKAGEGGKLLDEGSKKGQGKPCTRARPKGQEGFLVLEAVLLDLVV